MSSNQQEVTSRAERETRGISIDTRQIRIKVYSSRKPTIKNRKEQTLIGEPYQSQTSAMTG
jgi:hypothetical protein